MLVLEERDAPLTVEHHRELARLERVRGRELVTGARLPADELVVAVVVDERSSASLSSLVHPAPARGWTSRSCRSRWRRSSVAVGADARAAVVEERRSGRSRRRRASRRRSSRVSFFAYAESSENVLGGRVSPAFLKSALVVVEAVGVGEERQRAARALVLRVVPRRRREDVDVDLVLLEIGREVDPAPGRAEDADVLGLRTSSRRPARCPERSAAMILSSTMPPTTSIVDVRVLRVVLRDDLLELVQLVTGAPADPDRELRRGAALRRRRRAWRRRPPRRARDLRERRPAPLHASHRDLLLGRSLRSPRADSAPAASRQVRKLYESRPYDLVARQSQATCELSARLVRIPSENSHESADPTSPLRPSRRCSRT